MSKKESVLVVAVKTRGSVIEENEGIAKLGFSDAELYIKDIKIAEYFRKIFCKYCLFTDSSSGNFVSVKDSNLDVFLEAHLPSIVHDEDLLGGEVGRSETTYGLESKIDAFGEICRAAAAYLAKESVDHYDLSTLDLAKSIATGIQHQFELSSGYSFIVHFGRARCPVEFNIDEINEPELSPKTITISGVVRTYVSGTQVLCSFKESDTGKKITVEGPSCYCSDFKSALGSGENIKFSAQPFGSPKKYTRVRITSPVERGVGQQQFNFDSADEFLEKNLMI
jgi:hypothetical protein